MYKELVIDITVPQAEKLLELHNQFIDDSDFDHIDDFHGELLFNISDHFDQDSINDFTELDYDNIFFADSHYSEVIRGMVNEFPLISGKIKEELFEYFEDEEKECGLCGGVGISSCGRSEDSCGC